MIRYRHHPRQLPSLKIPTLSPPHMRSGWYIHGFYEGKFYTRGPKNSEQEARAAGSSMFPVGSQWDVTELPTRSLQAAKAMLRDKNLTKGMTLNVAMQHHLTAHGPKEQE